MRVLVVSLVPSEVLARVVATVRQGHPEARITALAGRRNIAVVDEILEWRSLAPAGLCREIRARRFDALVVAHGRDQYAGARYWKALGLAVVSGARRKRVCPDGRVPGRGLAAAVGAGVAGAAFILFQHVLAAVFASLVLAPVLLVAAVTDLTEALAGAPARRPAGGQAGAAAAQGQDRFKLGG